MSVKGVVCAAVVALGLVAAGASVTDNMPDETEFWQAKINAATYCAGGYAGTVQRCLFTGNKGS